MDCVTLWIGESLGGVERACLRSVLRQGHDLALYCYAPVAGVPDGVEVRGAADILPASGIFRHASGSVAPFSDWFRYELQRRGAGTWIDTDIYLLAPLDGRAPCLFGEQGDGIINNAVLRLPANSPALPALLKPFEDGAPDELSWPEKWFKRARQLVAGRTNLTRLAWGATGPTAMTKAADAYDLSRFALPAEVFYPVPWEGFDWIRDPTVSLDDVVTQATVAIHLWNELIKDFKNEPAPEGSFLERLQREGQ